MSGNGIECVRKSNKELAAIYKGQLAEKLGPISMSQKQREDIQSFVAEALDNMMPIEKVEETEIKEDNVACKLLLKGQPNNLFRAIEPIIKSLVVYTKSGAIDVANTPEYVMTLMLEKVKKP